jgi:hypothetical protein
MPAEFEAAAQLEQVRLRGGLPSTDARFTNARLLALMTSELRDNVAPLVHEAKAEHGILTNTVAVTAGTATYRMPVRAFGGTLRDVVWVDSGNNAYPLHQRSSADTEVLSRRSQTGDPRYYYLRGSNIVLVPTPGVSGTLHLPAYGRPGSLVLRAAVGVITSVSVVGTDYVIICADSPHNNGDVCDLVRGESGFETIGTATVQFDGTSEFIFPIASTTDAPAAGDYICLAGESPVPQVPVELHALLQARTAFVAVGGTGEGGSTAQALAAQVADLEAKARAWLRPRVESGTPPIGRGMRMHPLLGAAG